MAAVAAAGARVAANGEPGYPALLSHIENAPPLIVVRGHTHLLETPAVAVVGARNASLNGRRLAQEIAAGLGRAGMAVVSGLARGIDARAHDGALATGSTDVVYPKENAALHDAIAEQGALISEMAPVTVPQACHFPRRNRLISGLALEQGCEVFAVPGSPLDPRARGSNHLIRQGATLVESAEEVKGALAGMLLRPLGEWKPLDFKPLSPNRQASTSSTRRVPPSRKVSARHRF